MNQIKKLNFTILIFFSVILSSCVSQPTPELAPDQTVVNITFTTSINEIVGKKIYACQQEIPNLIVYPKLSQDMYLPVKPSEISIFFGNSNSLSNDHFPGINLYQISSVKPIVLVNSDNPIQSLTKQKTRDILSGSVQNWSAVEGAGRPAAIQVYTLMPGSDLRQIFDSAYLIDSQITTTAVILPSAAAVADKVSQNPAGIGITLERYVTSSSKKVRVFPEPGLFIPVLASASDSADPEVIQLINCLSNANVEHD